MPRGRRRVRLRPVPPPVVVAPGPRPRLLPAALEIGLVGGLVAFLLQWGLYSLIVSKIMSTMAAGIITVLPFASVALPLLLVFLGVGVLVGVFGGLTAIRNYLKV